MIGTIPSDQCYQIERQFGSLSSMKDRELIVMFGAAIFVLIAVAIMVFLHEKHYRDRRVIIDSNLGIEDRVSNIEKILLEDRYT